MQVRIRIIRQFCRQLLPGRVSELDVQGRDYAVGDVRLDLEHVIDSGIERLLPARDATLCVDQFRTDTHASGGASAFLPSNGAGQDVADAELVTNLLR